MKEDEKVEDGEDDDKHSHEDGDAATMSDSDWALWQKQDKQPFETAFLLWCRNTTPSGVFGF